MTNQTDLFGNGAKQGSLFGDGDTKMKPAKRSTSPDPDKIRRRLTKLLDTLRTAEAMPWNERDSKMWQTVFPNMANWLPDDEAEQLRLEFNQELDRLKTTA